MINNHWQLWPKTNPPDQLHQLFVDEWGPWYSPAAKQLRDLSSKLSPFAPPSSSGMPPRHLPNRHPKNQPWPIAPKLITAPQLTASISLTKTCVVTPVGHVFRPVTPPQPANPSAPSSTLPPFHYDRRRQPASFWSLNGSASLQHTNLSSSPSDPSSAMPRNSIIPASAKSNPPPPASHRTHPSDVHAHTPSPQTNRQSANQTSPPPGGPNLHYTFAPASVTKLTCELV